MQTNPAPVLAGTASQAPAVPQATFTGPVTAGEIQGLRSRRDELSSQLISAAGRRKALAKELRSATGTDKSGLEQRITVLDERIVQLESDIASTGRQLTRAPAGLLAVSDREAAGPRAFGIFSADQFLGLSIVFTVLVLFPLAMASARQLWKRANRPAPAPALTGEAAQRLERLEQSVDAVAVEIERISEGQRFVTRLLSTGSPQPALNAAQKDTVAIRVPSKNLQE